MGKCRKKYTEEAHCTGGCHETNVRLVLDLPKEQYNHYADPQQTCGGEDRGNHACV